MHVFSELSHAALVAISPQPACVATDALAVMLHSGLPMSLAFLQRVALAHAQRTSFATVHAYNVPNRVGWVPSGQMLVHIPTSFVSVATCTTADARLSLSLSSHANPQLCFRLPGSWAPYTTRPSAVVARMTA